MKRLAAMQDCPLLIMRAFTAVATALSRSALGITMNGSLPPSSSTVFLMCLPGCAATCAARGLAAGERDGRDARVVDDARATWPEPISSVWNTPSGKPARRKISSMASAHCGTLDACLSRPHVARHQRRRGEAEDLPERKVPRHHGQHGPIG